MSEQENVQTVKDLYAAFNRGDIQAILDPLVEDVDWGYDKVANDEVPWYGISKGPEAVRDDFFSPIAEEVDIQFFDITPTREPGDIKPVSHLKQGGPGMGTALDFPVVFGDSHRWIEKGQANACAG